MGGTANTIGEFVNSKSLLIYEKAFRLLRSLLEAVQKALDARRSRKSERTQSEVRQASPSGLPLAVAIQQLF
jgi:hypothetical protein